MPEVDGDGDYFVPLTDQRVFGAGIKKKGIAFVPASNEDQSTSPSLATTSISAGDRYLAIVLGKNSSAVSTKPTNNIETDVSQQSGESVKCAICRQPVATGRDQAAVDMHETSIAHQVCMEHSHPPSHLDRDHVGLKYLSGYGWDPDARKGLGAREEGIRVPIKSKEKRDTAGLGTAALNDDEDDDTTGREKKKSTVKKEARVVKLNLKEVRKLEMEKQKRAEKLRHAFYGEDLSEYLGGED